MKRTEPSLRPLRPDPSIATDLPRVEAARRRHAPALRSYVAELLRGDRARIEAVLAETWTALAPAHAAESETRLAEWIFSEARRRAQAGVRTTVAAEDQTREDDGSPEAIFDRLTPKQREVLHLRLGPEFRHEQIASIVELSPAHVAQLLHVALGRLAPAFRQPLATEPRGGRQDDVRLTLAALDELEGEARRVWEAGWTDPVATLARIEEVRRAARWSATHLMSGHRRTRLTAIGRIKRVARSGVVFVVLAIAAGAAFWLSRERPERGAEIAPRREGEFTPRPIEVAVLSDEARRDRDVEVGSAENAAAEARTLGVFREHARASGEAKTDTEQPRRDAPRFGREAEARDVDVIAGVGGDAASAFRGGGNVAGASHGPQAVGRAASTIAESVAAAHLAPVASTDTAAIVALKRALGQGRWPKPEEVDGLKLQAYFAARARASARALLFEKKFEAAPAPWDKEKLLVRAAAQAPDAPPLARPRANVILLLDISGSMDAPNRLPLAQEAIRGLIDRLRPEDRVGLVTYAGESNVLLPPTELVDPGRVRSAVMALQARGRTNGGAGLAEAFALAKGDGPAEHLVLLCTDGEFNMGASSEDQLAELVRIHARAGVRLAIFGFGRAGQIDPRLEKLAALGGGGSGYVNTRADAVRVMLGQLQELISPVARDVWLALGPGEPGSTQLAALAHADALLPGDTLAALAEIPARDSPARARLDYTLARDDGARTERWSGSAEPVDFAQASADFRFAAAVARLGELLRGPREDAAREWDALEAWATGAVDDAGGYRAEFLALVAQARSAR